SGGNMPSVLVVDDSITDRKLAVGLLQRVPDFTVYEAADGKEALQSIGLHLPDLVVTDMQMPNMNGLELVSQIKEQFPLTPVILMTSQGSEEIAVQALQKGAASYVPKRVMATDLVDTIDRVMAATQQVRGRARLVNRMTQCEYAFSVENDLELVCAVAA